jgi:hypothetical protein
MTTIQEIRRLMEKDCERFGGRRCMEDGEEHWEFAIGKFTLHIQPWLRQPRSGLHIGLDCAIGHEELGALVCQIFGDTPHTFQCMRWVQRTVELPSAEHVGNSFSELLSDFLIEVGTMRLTDLISEFRQNRPDQPSMAQLLHIGALAWVGDFNTLEDYVSTFRRGHRLNFAPMITLDMIQRAADVAADRYAGERSA